MAILLPLILFLLPIAILPGLLFYFDVTPKILLLLFGAAACLLCLRTNAAAVRALLAERGGKWFAALLGVQQLSLITATLLSVNPALSFGGSNWRRFGLVTQTALPVFALLAAAHFAVNRRVLARTLWAMTCSGCIAAAYGILQYLGWDPLLPAASYSAGEAQFAIVRPPGTLGHAAYFATYLLYALFCGVAILERHRILGWCACTVIPLAILLSGTRAALLGLLAGALLLAYYKRPSWRVVAATAGLFACVVVALLFSPAGERLRARVHWSLEDLHGGARLLLWRDSLRFASAHWTTGTGLETFGSSFLIHQSVELSRAYPDFYYESPHNVFLDALTSQGVPGLAVLMALCAVALAGARRRPALAAGFAAGLVSLQFTSFTAATAAGLFVLAAALVCPSDRPASADVGRSHPAGTVKRIGALSAAAALFLAAASLAFADYELEQARSAFAAGRPDAAAEAYRAIRRWALPGVAADLYYSREMLQAGRLDDAREAGQRALQTAEDRQNACYNLAAVEAALNNAPGVEANLTAAIHAAPNWFKPHWTLAKLYAETGRLEEAEREAALAVNLDGSKHSQVTGTLSQIRALRGH